MRRKGSKSKKYHSHYRPRTSTNPSGHDRIVIGSGGLAPLRRWNEFRTLEGEDRQRVVEMLTRQLEADLSGIKPVPTEDWTPPRLAIASGLSVSQVTRIFHDDPSQQRWRQFARDLRELAEGFGRTATESARVLALTPGHQYCQSANGILRLARAMGIEVDELLKILLRVL